MQTDLPHTLYFNDKGKGGNDYKYNPDDPAIKKQMEAIQKREMRKEKESEGTDITFTMDEIFK